MEKLADFLVTESDIKRTKDLSSYIVDKADEIAISNNYQLISLKISENGANDFFYPNMTVELWGIKRENSD